MLRLIVTSVALLLLKLIAPADVMAQDRGLVVVTVKSVSGDPIAFARLHVKASRTDTTVRSNDAGSATFVLPFGTLHLSAQMIGYLPFESDITVDEAESSVNVEMRPLPQSLSTVKSPQTGSVSVAPSVTAGLTKVLANVSVHASSGDRKVTTDSAGRFAMRLDSAHPAVLRLDLKGYRSRTVYVDVKAGTNPDIVVLLSPGKEPNIVALNMFDFGVRSNFLGAHNFFMGREALAKTGQLRLEDALFESGMLTEKGLHLNRFVQVFENGDPVSPRHLNDYLVNDVEFIEVWSGDPRGTFSRRLGKTYLRYSATEATHGTQRGNAVIVNVWLRK